MPSKTIPSITVLYTDFDRLAQSDDQTIIGHMTFALRNSRKKLFPKSVKCDRYKVSRNQNIITIHLYNDKTEAARFAFARAQV
jgi:hypothetical protein